jgi:hypothetical protein
MTWARSPFISSSIVAAMRESPQATRWRPSSQMSPGRLTEALRARSRRVEGWFSDSAKSSDFGRRRSAGGYASQRPSSQSPSAPQGIAIWRRLAPAWPLRVRPDFALGTSSNFPVAILPTMTALPITSAGASRLWGLGASVASVASVFASLKFNVDEAGHWIFLAER